MHNNFLDKRRRFINLKDDQVKNVLPEHYAASYPKFIQLLEKYYEWQDTNNSTELLHHLFASRDINETDITLLKFIEDELLLGEAYFDSFGDTTAELRAAANFSNTLFRSKGSKFAIEWFFRSFYGSDVEIKYTKENVFNLNEGESRIGPDSLHYITDDKLYQTWALLVKAEVPISKWKETFKLFVHPAGMYLGGEVINTGREIIEMVEEDSTSFARGSTTYILGSLGAVTDEGQIYDLTLTANDLPNNYGIAKYYLQFDSTNTSADDFSGPAPTIDSPLQFNLDSVTATSAEGTVAIRPRIDSDETEGLQAFTVFFLDDEDREITNVSLTVQDVISSYTMTNDLSSDSANEGDTITFNLQGTNVPNNGSTTLFYYIDHGTTIDSDFFGLTTPSAASPAAFPIYQDSGSFSIKTRIDSLTDTENFTVKVKTGQGIEKASTLITLNDVPATFSFDPVTVTEGANLTMNLNASLDVVGQTVNWSVDSNSYSRIPRTTGSFLVTGVNDTYTLVGTTVSNVYQGATTVNMTATTSGTDYTPSLTDTQVYTINNEASVYTPVITPATGAEGDTVQLSFTGTNIPNGTYYWFKEDVDTNPADFTGPMPNSGARQAVTITDNASGNYAITFGDSGDTAEDFIIRLFDTGPGVGGTQLAELSYTIQEAGTVISLSVDDTTANEGQELEFTFQTSVGNGTHYYWIDGDVNSSDFSSGYASNTSREDFTVSGGGGSFNITLSADGITEGSESFRVYVSETASGGILAESPLITVADTSTSSWTVTPTNPREGNNLVVTIFNVDQQVDIFTEIDGIDATRIPINQASSFHDYTVNAITTETFSTVSNGTYYGDSTGTVYVTSGTYYSSGGVILGSNTFTISDALPTYTLTTNLTGDSANEDDTITFTFGGSEVPNGSYYYRPINTVATTTDQISNSGTFFVYLTSTTGITTGMTANNASVAGTVQSITAGSGVTMTNALTGTVAVDTEIIFGDFTDYSSSYSGNAATGSFSFGGSPDSKTFDVDLTEDDDKNTETLTMGVYDDHGGTLVKSKAFTVYSPASFEVEFSDNGYPSSAPVAAYPNNIVVQSETFDTKIAYLDILDTGLMEDNAPLTVANGYGKWIQDLTGWSTANAADYEVRFTSSNTPSGNGAVEGSLGTWLGAETNPRIGIDGSFMSNGEGSVWADVTVEIREIADTSNSESFTLDFSLLVIDEST